jgi:hypothetical protein
MALTAFQRVVIRLLASRRIGAGESYLAGGAALNTLIESSRLSRDIDLFHDTAAAVDAAWEADRTLLVAGGHEVRVIRQRPGYVEAAVTRGGDAVEIQWTTDSAFRFFPLVRHDELGLTLHPFDLATNKVLALVGRLEARDWIDTIESHDHIQRLGYLAWAACAKDPAFSPSAILEEAGRSARYSAAEIGALAFDGPPPDAAALSRRWHAMLDESSRLVALLPPEQAGMCVLDPAGNLYSGGAADLERAVEANALRFHAGSIHGALPRIV